jgi:hypothetical protein
MGSVARALIMIRPVTHPSTSHPRNDENMIPPPDQEGAGPAVESASDKWVRACPEEHKATNERGLSGLVIFGAE